MAWSTGGGGSMHGDSSSHEAMEAAKMARLALRRGHSLVALKYYAAALCGLVAIFIFLHWARRLVYRFSRSGSNSAASSFITTPFRLISRPLRKVLIRNVPGIRSSGHGILVAVFIAINLIITFTGLHVDVIGSNLSTYAARFGWLAEANFLFLVFLALKNTPLAWLTSYSYERLNILHQIAGYTMFAYLVLHAATYTAYFASKGRLQEIYLETGQLAAIVAGFFFIIIVGAGAFLRRVWYELFYVLHVTFFVVAVICVGLHQPDFANKMAIITCLIGAAWICDRAIRGTRFVVNAVNNEATLEPLPNGGTRITLKKRAAGGQAGKHCFLWIPAIRRFEMHPFTIVATEPLEFIVNSYDGFTKDLHKYAKAHPGATLRASVEGPYGTFPDPLEYDKVVLIAGGSGASFTFGLAVNLIQRMKSASEKNVAFIWAVREHENLAWFTEHLKTLQTHDHAPQIDINLFVTRMPPPQHNRISLLLHNHSDESTHEGRPRTMIASPHSSVDEFTPTSPDIEKAIAAATFDSLPALAHPKTAGTEPEKAETAQQGRRLSKTATQTTAQAQAQAAGFRPLAAVNTATTTGRRPDAAALIRQAVATVPKGQRVLVAACGPDGLMRMVRNTTAELIRADGPGIELHCEQFGW